ncbi:MAG: hypothetical protein GXP33_13190 [Spirochaetes bacterium]|nr:hypothetical protein [Spirochaetota bacterium]
MDAKRIITITNEKIAGFVPVWAPFKGFSLLFDNPGDSLSPMPDNSSLYKINCNRPAKSGAAGDPELYKVFSLSLNGIEQLLSRHLFCPLPYSSYHVTVWDGLNDGNVHQIKRSDRPDAEDFLRRLPESLLGSIRFTIRLSGDPLPVPMKSVITFKFKKLSIWGTNVLVARLEPADSASGKYLDNIKCERRKLIEEYRVRFGVKTSTPCYAPHVSLGYFINKEYAESTVHQTERWTNEFLKRTTGKTISFSSNSLYGFLDMVTYFKKK